MFSPHCPLIITVTLVKIMLHSHFHKPGQHVLSVLLLADLLVEKIKGKGLTKVGVMRTIFEVKETDKSWTNLLQQKDNRKKSL